MKRALLSFCLCLAACEEKKPPTGAPHMLASRTAGEGAIVVDDAFVYWIDRGTTVPDPAAHTGKVWRTVKAGALPTALAKDLTWPKGLALDDERLYWAGFAEGKVFSLDKRGGTPVAIAEGQSAPRDVAVDATDVYFVTTAGEVKRVPKKGGAVTTVASGQRRPWKVAVDNEWVFWLDGGTEGMGNVQPDGAVMRAKKDGTARSAIARGLREPGGLALDLGQVYWIDRSDGRLWRADKDGATPRQLAREQWNALQLVVDDASVFWQVGERIERIRKAGGETQLWTKAAFTVGGLAVDADRLYFLENNGAVRSLPK